MKVERHQYSTVRSMVVETLSRRQATFLELREITGASSSTIEKVIQLLRAERHPCIENIQLLRRSSRADLMRKEMMSQRETVAIVQSGLESRTPLERAWAQA